MMQKTMIRRQSNKTTVNLSLEYKLKLTCYTQKDRDLGFPKNSQWHVERDYQGMPK